MPNFPFFGVSNSPLFLEMAKYGPFMAKTWSSHGPSNWFFLNHNQCAPGCSMPNFTILGVSNSPLFLEMAKTCPFYGQNKVLQICSPLILINVYRYIPHQILHWCMYSVAPIPRNGQNMALLWQNMVLI